MNNNTLYTAAVSSKPGYKLIVDYNTLYTAEPKNCKTELLEAKLDILNYILKLSEFNEEYGNELLNYDSEMQVPFTISANPRNEQELIILKQNNDNLKYFSILKNRWVDKSFFSLTIDVDNHFICNSFKQFHSYIISCYGVELANDYFLSFFDRVIIKIIVGQLYLSRDLYYGNEMKMAKRFNSMKELYELSTQIDVPNKKTVKTYKI